MNYFLTIPAVLAVAAGLGALFRQVRFRIDDRAAVAAATLITAAVYLALGLWQYRAMRVGLWDFGIYDSMLSIAAAGGGAMRDFRGGWFDHFSPVTMLLVPCYQLADSPLWLIAVQPLALAAAGPLLFLTAKRYFPRGPFPLLLTLMYFLNPYFSRTALFDFHIECLFPLLFFGAFLAYAHRKFGAAALLLALTPLVKEDFVVPTAAAGLLMMSRGASRRHGAAVFGAALFWTFFVLKIYYPCILRADYLHYGRFELFGATAAETLNNAGTMLARLVTRNAAAAMLSVLLPFALLPLAHWRGALLLWLPVIAIQLVSGFLHQQLLMSHYASALIAVTPVAALWGARALRGRFRRRTTRRRAALAFAAALAVVCHAAYCELPLSRYDDYLTGYNPAARGGFLSLPFSPEYRRLMKECTEHAAAFRAMTARLPVAPDDDVVCQNELGVEFLRRGRVHSLPGPENAAFYCFDQGNYTGYDRPETINPVLTRLLADPEYRMLRSPEGWIVFAARRKW